MSRNTGGCDTVKGEWVEWVGESGLPQGVDSFDLVEVQLRDGSYSDELIPAGHYSWRHFNNDADIIRYRVVKEEEPPLKQQTQPCTPNHCTDMTLRDCFAAKATPALLAAYCESAKTVGFDEFWMVGIAIDAYKMADAMLKVREVAL